MDGAGTKVALVAAIGLFLQLCVSSPTTSGEQTGPNYQTKYEELVDSLLEGYNSEIIPVPSSGGPLNVTLILFLVDILEVDIERNQVEFFFHLFKHYKDERLAWDPAEYGLARVHVPQADLWPLDVTFQNNIGTLSHQPKQSDLAELTSDGAVVYVENRRVRTLCQVYALSDRHAAQCEVKVGSSDYDRSLLYLTEPTSNTANGLLFSDTSKYILVNMTARKDTTTYDTVSYEEMVCTITFGRITPPDDK